MFEYRKAPEKTAAAYTRDGAFTVGDTGYVDADGYLFISGRTADVIVSSGVNVYPAEIEETLATLPGVRDVCVVGGPDDLRGETPVAFVVLDRDARRDPAAEQVALDALFAACAARLAGYQRSGVGADDPGWGVCGIVAECTAWPARTSTFRIGSGCSSRNGICSILFPERRSSAGPRRRSTRVTAPAWTARWRASRPGSW
jgi:hypothetical protein